MKTSKLFLIPVLLIFISIHSISQVSQQWCAYKSYGKGQYIIYDTTGYLDVSGSATMMDAPTYTTVIKYSISGTEIWSKTCVGYTAGFSMDSLKNLYAGCFYGGGWGESYQISLYKYNQSGIQQWAVRDTSTNPAGTLVRMIGDKAGNSYMSIYRSSQFETSMFNASGTRLWLRYFNAAGSTDNHPEAISLDKYRNIYITGRSTINNNNYVNTVKYNPAGVQQWVATYTPPFPALGGNSVNDIAIDTASNIYVLGYTSDTASNNYLTLIKYNSSGVQQWVSRYLQVSNSGTAILKLDAAGNIFVACYIAVIKYNPSGVQQWVISNLQNITNLTCDKFNNLYAGRIASYNSFSLFRYSSSGVQQWSTTFSTNNNNMILNSIVLDTAQNVYAEGGDDYLSGPPPFLFWIPEFITVKYSQLVAIKKISSNISNDFSLNQNYPNPFNPTTKIKYDIPKSVIVSLKIYDLLGREVKILVNETQSPGSYEIIWDAQGCSSGIYFYTLTAGDYIQTKMMVLLK